MRSGTELADSGGIEGMPQRTRNGILVFHGMHKWTRGPMYICARHAFKAFKSPLRGSRPCDRLNSTEAARPGPLSMRGRAQKNNCGDIITTRGALTCSGGSRTRLTSPIESRCAFRTRTCAAYSHAPAASGARLRDAPRKPCRGASGPRSSRTGPSSSAARAAPPPV